MRRRRRNRTARRMPVRRTTMPVIRPVTGMIIPVFMGMSPIMLPVIVFITGTNRGGVIMRIMRIAVPSPVIVDALRVFADETDIQGKLRRRQQTLDPAVAFHPEVINLGSRFIPIAAIAPGFALDPLAVFVNNLMILRGPGGRQAKRLFHPPATLAMRFIPAETDPKLAVAGEATSYHQQTDQTDSFHVSHGFK